MHMTSTTFGATHSRPTYLHRTQNGAVHIVRRRYIRDMQRQRQGEREREVDVVASRRAPRRPNLGPVASRAPSRPNLGERERGREREVDVMTLPDPKDPVASRAADQCCLCIVFATIGSLFCSGT